MTTILDCYELETDIDEIDVVDASDSVIERLCAEYELSADEMTARLIDDHRETSTDVEVYDDGATGWGDYKWFVAGHEFGPCWLIRAGSLDSACEIWIDESPTIDPSDIHEAHGAFDKLVGHLESKGHENTRELRDFANRYCQLYFDIDTRDANYTGAWDRWSLIEGYQYQSNCSGTGIVEVGHYEWIKPIAETCYRAAFTGKLS
jgi:hypothetical protein